MRKNNTTLKKFKLLNRKPDPIKKGNTYSVEKVNGSNNFIVKKYVNGNLYKQVIITYQKLKYLVQKQINKSKKNKTAKRGGATTPPQQAPQQIQVQDNTSMWTIFKQAFAFDIGLNVADGIFDSLF